MNETVCAVSLGGGRYCQQPKGRAADIWGDGADEEWLRDEATDALAAVRGALGGEGSC